jgi:uncharacterized membrane protein
MATPAQSWPRRVGRIVLGAFLVLAGVSHLVNPAPFQAQVPPWFPAPAATILVSGLIEITLGVALLVVRARRSGSGSDGPGGMEMVGWATAGFFVVIFPGNISQFVTGTDAFGLDSDVARAVRLLFQPVLVVWALWCTGAWTAWRSRRSRPRSEP